jgi:hypothetical protein
VIGKRIGAIRRLGQGRHSESRERWDLVRPAGHGDALGDDFDVELRPRRRTEQRIDRDARAADSTRNRPTRAGLEGEPVTTIKQQGVAKISFGLLPAHRTVDIDVDRVAHGDVAGK